MKTLHHRFKIELPEVIPNYEATLAALTGNYLMLPGPQRSYFSHFFTRCFAKKDISVVYQYPLNAVRLQTYYACTKLRRIGQSQQLTSTGR